MPVIYHIRTLSLLTAVSGFWEIPPLPFSHDQHRTQPCPRLALTLKLRNKPVSDIHVQVYLLSLPPIARFFVALLQRFPSKWERRLGYDRRRTCSATHWRVNTRPGQIWGSEDEGNEVEQLEEPQTLELLTPHRNIMESTSGSPFFPYASGISFFLPWHTGPIQMAFLHNTQQR